MVNEGVVTAEETVLGVVGTSKARKTRPNLPSNPNLRLAPHNSLLLTWLPLSTPSSSVTSRPPSSRSHLRRFHHSTRASTKLYLWRGESALPPPLKPSSVLRASSVPLTLIPSKRALLLTRMRSLLIGLGTKTTWMSSWRNLLLLVHLGPHKGMCAQRERTIILTSPQ